MKYQAVQWNRKKVIYDLVLIAGVLIFVNLFQFVGARVKDVFGDGQVPNSQILAMRAWGTCAFAMLTGILLIGPLARLNPKFKALLYNRRHFGVIFFAVAVMHAKQVLDFYHGWGSISKLESLLSFDAAFTSASWPFQLFGAAALIIFLVMAATSHDFWQKFLGPSLWKTLHMSVYLGYFLVVAHVAFGALQMEHHPLWGGLVYLSVATVVGLHLWTGFRTAKTDRPISVAVDGWLDLGPVSEIPQTRPFRALPPSGEVIAICRQGDEISAVHGVCAHQGGPLGEGRVIEGCLTCPWHGWQYQPQDGCAPAPFTEKIPTYRLRLDDRNHLWVETCPQAPGTLLEPIRVNTP